MRLLVFCILKLMNSQNKYMMTSSLTNSKQNCRRGFIPPSFVHIYLGLPHTWEETSWRSHLILLHKSLLIYKYFKILKCYSWTLGPCYVICKKSLYHKEIIEKSCNTAPVKIISLIGCEKLTSLVNKVSPFAHSIILII